MSKLGDKLLAHRKRAIESGELKPEDMLSYDEIEAQHHGWLAEYRELKALRAEVERLKRIEELALVWLAYQFDSRRALHQQADDAAIALLDALDSDKVAARLDAAKRSADPTTGQ